VSAPITRCNRPHSFTKPTFGCTKLAVFDQRKSRIAELRFFGGLSLEEMAQVLDISVGTVERDWQAARGLVVCDVKA